MRFEREMQHMILYYYNNMCTKSNQRHRQTIRNHYYDLISQKSRLELLFSFWMVIKTFLIPEYRHEPEYEYNHQYVQNLFHMYIDNLRTTSVWEPTDYMPILLKYPYHRYADIYHIIMDKYFDPLHFPEKYTPGVLAAFFAVYLAPDD